MTREQVIKGLECCASNITCQDDCPYYLECTDDQQALMKDALALLKEQEPYFDGATLDRINTNEGYSPKNCRWATMFEQDRNRRNSVLIEYEGKMLNISELAKVTGIKRSTLNNRYWRGDRGERLTREVLL